MFHKNLGLGDQHIPYNWAYDDESARTGATGLVIGDIGKLCRQLDDNSVWMLTNYSPTTWVNVSTGGVDSTAIHKATAAEISAMTEKVTPVSADLVVIEDSAAGNAKKKVQIGNLPSTIGNFGKDHQSAASEGSSTTTSSTYQDKVSLTTGALTGTYLVSFSHEATPQTANKRVQSRLYNSTDAAELCFDDHRPVLANLFKITSGFATVVFSGVAKTFKIQYASQDNSTTVEIRRARIELWRLS
jgi:hypothetical protein